MKGFSHTHTHTHTKLVALKVDVIGPDNIVCRRVRASFSPGILQAGAMKGLTSTEATYSLLETRQSGEGSK